MINKINEILEKNNITWDIVVKTVTVSIMILLVIILYLASLDAMSMTAAENKKLISVIKEQSDMIRCYQSPEITNKDICTKISFK